MKIKNIFLTGDLHIGKTTIINQVTATLPHLKVGGFRTSPVFEEGKKKGFTFDSLTGIQQIFAHVELKTENQFDIYKFDLTIFEEAGVFCLEQALENSDLILMDEIGMMERQTIKFQQIIIACLNSKKPVLGAFQQRASWFAAILKNSAGAKIFHVTETNRDFIPDQIIALIN